MRNKGFCLLMATLFIAPGLKSWGQSQPQPLTVKQKEHSKLYKNHGGKKLTDPGAQGGELIEDLSMTIPPETPQEFLRQAGCAADAVVVGSLVQESAALTEDEKFIFTDYQLKVDEILKNNAAASFSVGTEISVTRPGGGLQINGRHLRTAMRNFREFHLGERYLLYLKFIPATGAYQAFGNRSFELRPNTFSKLTREQLWNDSRYKLEDEATFLEQARQSLPLPYS